MLAYANLAEPVWAASQQDSYCSNTERRPDGKPAEPIVVQRLQNCVGIQPLNAVRWSDSDVQEFYSFTQASQGKTSMPRLTRCLSNSPYCQRDSAIRQSQNGILIRVVESLKQQLNPHLSFSSTHSCAHQQAHNP